MPLVYVKKEFLEVLCCILRICALENLTDWEKVCVTH